MAPPFSVARISPAGEEPAAIAPAAMVTPDLSQASCAPLELTFQSREAWQNGLRRFMPPLDCSVADAKSFQCSAVVSRLRGSAVAELRTDASRLVRRAIHLVDGESEPVKVAWLLAGRARVQQGPNSGTLDAGAWSVFDPAREYVIDLDRGARLLVLLVPRSQCPGMLSALNVLSGRALAKGGPANIAAASLAALLRDDVPLDAHSEGTLHDSVIALIQRALALELDARGLEAQPERSVQLAHVQAYILEHLADTTLNVGRLASVFGTSRRNLYNIFVPSGVTPHAYIQCARLHRACGLLEQPAARNRSVANVARLCGFSDPAHFSRAFHARHGLAPTLWRGRGALALAQAPGKGGVPAL